MPFKTFTVGSLLTASDVNAYLMSQAIIRCTSLTRPSSPSVGWHIWETDTKRLLWYNGTTWNAYPKALMGRVTADQSNNTSTAANVTGMSVPVDANSTYLIEGYLRYVIPTGTSAGPVVFGWTTPAGSTHHWTSGARADWNTNFYGPLHTLSQSGEYQFGGDTGGAGTGASPCGWLQTAGTAGTLQLQFRELFGGATNPARILTGSWMRVTLYDQGY